jgi:hypothetical protein
MATKFPTAGLDGSLTITNSSCVSTKYALFTSAKTIGVPALGDADPVPSDGEELGLALPVPSLGEAEGERLPETEGVPADGELLGLADPEPSEGLALPEAEGVTPDGEALAESEGEPSSGDTDGLVSVSFSQWIGPTLGDTSL